MLLNIVITTTVLYVTLAAEPSQLIRYKAKRPRRCSIGSMHSKLVMGRFEQPAESTVDRDFEVGTDERRTLLLVEGVKFEQMGSADLLHKS